MDTLPADLERSVLFFYPPLQIPVYDFSTHSRRTETVTKYGANVIVFEGIFTFATQELCDLMDLKIFVDEDADVRLARRLKVSLK